MSITTITTKKFKRIMHVHWQQEAWNATSANTCKHFIEFLVCYLTTSYVVHTLFRHFSSFIFFFSSCCCFVPLFIAIVYCKQDSIEGNKRNCLHAALHCGAVCWTKNKILFHVVPLWSTCGFVLLFVELNCVEFEYFFFFFLSCKFLELW